MPAATGSSLARSIVTTAPPLPLSAYQELFSRNPLPMFAFEADTLQLVEVNAAAAAELGVSREALLTLAVPDITSDVPPDQATGRTRRFLNVVNGAATEFEVTFLRLDPADPADPALGLGVATRAARQAAPETLLREMNERLVLSGLREQSAREDAEHANSAKDDFLAVMSHELRTPLQAMLGWITLLRSGRLGDTDSDHALEVIERNARVQAQLVSDLLDVSRAARGKLRLDVRPLDLLSVVAGAIESQRPEIEEKGIELESALEGGSVLIDGDQARLEQVVGNLLVNAVKFTPRGGTVRVSVDVNGSNARLRIADTGEGFEPEFAPKMFQGLRQEQFNGSRNKDGLGLGLMIVRHLVEAHNGTVWAESDGAGQGATFTVTLPVTQRAVRSEGTQGHAAGKAESGPSDGRGVLVGLRTLVVEDHADTREFLNLVLQRSGAEVRDAGSAREALAILADTPVDLIVSDLGMPEIDGYAFLDELRKIDGPLRDVPVVAVSAFAGAKDRERSLAAGFCAHAAKPVEPRQLTKIVARAAGRSSG
jgi:signal transduction histidine kinase